MSKTLAFLRALLALGVAVGGAWYLSVYSCSYPGGATPGLPPGFAPLGPDSPGGRGALFPRRPTAFAVGSLEHAHEIFLGALPEDAPQRLRFALPSTAELELRTLAAGRGRRVTSAVPELPGAPRVWPISPAGRVERELLFFAWEGAPGFDAHVEVREGEGEAEPPLARFRVTSAGGWYPPDAPPLEAGRDYHFRLAWNDGASVARRFRLATEAEARAFELARRALQRISEERYRALLEVLLAQADERTSTALELARRGRTLHAELAHFDALCALLEAELDLPRTTRAPR
jgi:hypothetical protein